MPKVLLTAEQKTADRNKKIRRAIADSLAVTKNRTRMSTQDLGEKIGISRNSVSKILAGESICLTMDNFIMLLDLAGLTIKRKVEDDL